MCGLNVVVGPVEYSSRNSTKRAAQWLLTLSTYRMKVSGSYLPATYICDPHVDLLYVTDFCLQWLYEVMMNYLWDHNAWLIVPAEPE